MNRLLAHFSLTLLMVLSTASGLQAAPVFREFYIAPSGADSNSGTKDEPFLTLARARDAVRAVNRQMAGEIVVYLRSGTYPVTAPVEFSPADSGHNGFQILYRAYEDERPVISGGALVTNWRPDQGGIFKARLNWDNKLRGLYVNGIRASMAQADFKGQGAWGEFVVKGDEPWAETSGKTLDGIQFEATEVPVFSQPQDIELLQHRVWNFLVMGVRELTKENNRTIVKLQQPYGAIAATMAWRCNIDPNDLFTIRNAYELLKAPGQFYFNRATHTLYYYPRPGEDLAQATVIAPLSEGLLRIAGESTANRVKNIAFTGLTFSFDHWLLEKVGDSRGMVGVQSLALYTKFRDDGNWHKSHYNICDLPQATVDLRNCRNIRFERNRFAHLSSGVAIGMVNDVVDSAVIGNAFDDLSGNAVNVGHPQHYVVGDGPLFSAGVEGVCARDKISNNWIRHVSLDFKQEEAISGFFTESVEISHNDIKGAPYGGIALGWWWGNADIPPSRVPKNNIIVANRVTDTQRILYKDGGPIYVLGKQPGGRIESNYVQGADRLIYPDDGSAYWTITNNVLEVVPDPAGRKGIGGLWLHIWTWRCNDLRIDRNYTNSAKTLNNGVNTEDANTVFQYPFPPAAQAIMAAAGLEPAYQDIRLNESR